MRDERSASKPGLVVAWSRVPQLIGARVALEGAISVGRGGDCCWCLDDRTLSRAHFEVNAGLEGAHIRDLGSSNGTILNGAPLQNEQELRWGAVIGAGACVFVVVDDLDALAEGAAEPQWEHAGVFYSKGIVDELRLAAASARPLLIAGARGVGKSLAAQELHRHWATTGRLGWLVPCHGNRVVDVAEMSRCLEKARGGTLHLTWALELPPETQRFLVDAALDLQSDVKLICETAEPLSALEPDAEQPLIEACRLIQLPPLRERRADVPSLFEHFLRGQLDGDALSEVLTELDTPKVVRLCSHDYLQGNVFELAQVVAVIRARMDYDDDALSALRRALDGLMIELDEGETTLPATTVPASARPSTLAHSPAVYRKHRDAIMSAFDEVGGDVARLEALLRARGYVVERVGLARHLERWGFKGR